MALRLLVATDRTVLGVDADTDEFTSAEGLDEAAPTCLAPSPSSVDRAWCGSREKGVFRSDDGGRSWAHAGLENRHITALVTDPRHEDGLWAGTEPSALWHTADGGRVWTRMEGLTDLPSSVDWAFPPRPDTHHVRWIASRPDAPEHLWLAIEAGALVTTPDGGESWRDRTPGGPRDTHELAIHPDRPETLRVAAGDGYFESRDAGESWDTPGEGLEVGYLRSVAIDPGSPEVVLVSASTRAHTAYVAGRSDGRIYRREDRGRWERVRDGWPDPAETIAPLLRAGARPGELWAADERGVHRSLDGGRRWEQLAEYPDRPSHLRGFTLLGG